MEPKYVVTYESAANVARAHHTREWNEILWSA